MGHKRKHGKPYWYEKSDLFDNTWLVVRREPLDVIGDVSDKWVAKRLAKELNRVCEEAEDHL